MMRVYSRVGQKQRFFSICWVDRKMSSELNEVSSIMQSRIDKLGLAQLSFQQEGAMVSMWLIAIISIGNFQPKLLTYCLIC